MNKHFMMTKSRDLHLKYPRSVVPSTQITIGFILGLYSYVKSYRNWEYWM